MTDLLMLVFVGVIVAIIVACISRPAGIYEFPILAAVVFAGFVLTQGFGLRSDSSLPEGSLARVFIMSILCLLACYVGFVRGAERMPFLNWGYDDRKLMQVSWILTIMGTVFWVLISRLPKELTSVSQWTGMPVAYRFFAQSFSYGLAIAMLLYLRTKSKQALGPILIGVFLYADLAVVGVRRSAGAELLLMVLLAFWYVRKKCIPKLAFFGIVVFGTLVMYSTGDIRDIIMGDKGYTSILKGDFLPSTDQFKKVALLDNMSGVLKSGAAEVQNAAHLMAGVSDEGAYDFGMNDWNVLVFNFIPAQLVGQDFKSAFLFKFDSPISRGSSGAYEMSIGSTVTGICDAFCSFGYLGFVKFLLIGWILGTLNRGALKGNEGAAILYMSLIVSGLEAITHDTALFFSKIVYICIFAIPALRYAKNRELRGGYAQTPVQPGRIAEPRRPFPARRAGARAFARVRTFKARHFHWRFSKQRTRFATAVGGGIGSTADGGAARPL